MSWCVEALRGYGGGAAGARLELGGALATLRALRAPASQHGARALQRLKAVARAHPQDRVLRAEASADAAFVAYAVCMVHRSALTTIFFLPFNIEP